jgi:hypothetical protein
VTSSSLDPRDLIDPGRDPDGGRKIRINVEETVIMSHL